MKTMLVSVLALTGMALAEPLPQNAVASVQTVAVQASEADKAPAEAPAQAKEAPSPSDCCGPGAACCYPGLPPDWGDGRGAINPSSCCK